MSFASDMKKELALIIPEKKCCLLAEIAGFLRMNGSIRLMGGGKLSVFLTSEDPAVARMMKKLIKIYPAQVYASSSITGSILTILSWENRFCEKQECLLCRKAAT